jgi:LacI family transcriptional regulator
VSTSCSEQLTFDIPPYSAVAAKCARPLSANGTQMIVAITENDPERQLRPVRKLAGSRFVAPVISPSVHMLKRRAGCSWGCQSPR